MAAPMGPLALPLTEAVVSIVPQAVPLPRPSGRDAGTAAARLTSKIAAFALATVLVPAGNIVVRQHGAAARLLFAGMVLSILEKLVIMAATMEMFANCLMGVAHASIAILAAA